MYRRHHDIKLEDAMNFVIETILASNSDEHKTLKVVVVPCRHIMKYHVHYKETVVYSGEDIQKAIDAYNSIGASIAIEL